MSSESTAFQIARSTNPGGIDHLSFSAVALYQACSLRYHMKYIAKLPEESVSATLVFGSAFHSALQFHYEHLLIEDERRILTSCSTCFGRTGMPASMCR